MEKQDWKDMAFYVICVGIVIGLCLGLWIGQTPQHKQLEDCVEEKSDISYNLLVCKNAIKNCALPNDLEQCQYDLKIFKLINSTQE